MIISSLNNFFAKHGRMTIGTGLLIIICFVFFYGDFGAFQGGSSLPPTVGKMYDKTISRKEFMSQFKAIKISYYLETERYLGSESNQLITLFSQDVLQRIRLLHKAEELNISAVIEEEIRDVILHLPIFQKDGTFDYPIFTDFKKNILRAERLSAREFDEIIRDNIVIKRLNDRITRAVVSSEQEAKINYMEQYIRSKAQISNFFFQSYMKDVEVTEKITEEEVKAYFYKNLEDKYRVPEQKQLQVVVFDAKKYRDDPRFSEQEMQAHYTNKKSDYTKDQLHLKHIFIPLSTNDTEAVEEKKKNKIQEALQQISRGVALEEVAKTYNEDKAHQDGNLGYMDVRRLRRLYGDEFLEAVEVMPLGETSSILHSKRGYHVVQKVDQRNSVPYEEVIDSLERGLRLEAQEQEAKDDYEERKEKEYSNEEVRASHILLKVSTDESKEEKDKKRKQLEDIRQEAQEKDNFAELAKKYSEDTGSAKKSGDLGYFRKGQMVKPFEEAAFSLKDGDISDIVESSFGYHLIQKIDHRDHQPFNEVKRQIMQQLDRKKKEEERKIAQEEATNYAVSLHNELHTLPPEKQQKAFLQFFQQYDQSKSQIIESGFFSGKDYSIPHIPGYTKKLIEQAVKLTPNNPVSEVVNSGDNYYIACLQETKGSYNPSFQEFKTIEGKEIKRVTKQGKKAKSDLKREKAIAIAREACWKEYEVIKKKMEEDIAFTEAKGDIAFSATEEFFLSQGPRGSNQSLIKSKAQETKANSLVAPQNISNGAILIYVQEHNLPTEESFDGIKSIWFQRYRTEKQRAALARYYDEIEKESKTTIHREWQDLLLPESTITDTSDR